MTLEEFSRWFNRDFWRVFRANSFPIDLPGSAEKRFALVTEAYRSIMSARYAPSLPETEIILNKGLGVARTIPVFSIRDYIVFYFCIKKLEPILCVNRTPNTFGGWKLGGIARKNESDEIEEDHGFSTSRYAFNPSAWNEAFGDFNSLLYAQIDAGAFTHAVQFDLSNFYDCVRLDILERWIREQSSPHQGWIIALLFYFLNNWNRKNTGLHPQAVGLPQDALSDCSRVLANFYLQRYDKYAHDLLSSTSGQYFRYSDDQILLLRKSDSVERLMLLLTRELDRYGLRVNQKKVQLWRVQNLLEHRGRKIQEIIKSDCDKANPRLVRRFAQSLLRIPAPKLGRMWNKGTPLLNRLLSCDTKDLPQKTKRNLLHHYTSDEYLLSCSQRRLRRVAALAEQVKPRIDLSRKLLRLGRRTCHNAFHIEVLAFAENAGNRKLAEAFKARLASLANLVDHRVSI